MFGAVPPRWLFVLLTALVWAGGWAGVAAATRSPDADVRAALPSAPLAAIVGGTAAVFWGLGGWWAGALSSPWWLGVLASLLMWWEGALVLNAAVRVVAASARGAPPGMALRAALGPAPAPAAPRAVVIAVAAAAFWYLLRLYLRLWMPDPLIAPWLAWPLLAAGAAVVLKALIACDAEVAASRGPITPEPLPKALTAARPAPFGGAYVLLAIGILLAGPRLEAVLFVSPAARGVAVAQRLLARRDWAGAESAARGATAAAAGAYALSLLEAGDTARAASAATAAVGIDPAGSVAEFASGMVAVADHNPDAALQAAEALAATGAAGRGAYIAALACPEASAPRGCRASAAAQAMWADPRLAWLGPRPAKAGRSVSAPADSYLNQAVTAWAEALGGSATETRWVASARADAGWQLLAAYTRSLPGLGASAEAQIALSGALAAASVGDANGVQTALAPLSPRAMASSASAEALLEAGSTYQSVAPDISGHAECSPLPRPLEQGALRTAEQKASPPALVLTAAQYLVLQGTGVGVGDCADTPESTVVGLLQRYTAVRPHAASGWDLLALAEYEQSKFAPSLQAASRALALGSRDQLAQEIAGESLWGEAQAGGVSPQAKAADMTAAAGHLRTAVTLNPAPFLPWMALGDVLDAEHQPAQALQAYQESQQWLQYDLAHRVDTFSAPGEGWGFTGLPQAGGPGPAALAARIQTVEQELHNHVG